ncbi:hypothetical protein [Salinispira pacifica]
MKISLLALIVMLPVAGLVYGQSSATSRADALDAQGRYEQARDILVQGLSAATTSADRADIYQRLSREYLNIADREHDAGKPKEQVLSIYDQGISYADQAIKADPNNPEGYFWKSGNIGRVGLLKGVMVSLDSVPTIKELLTKTIELNNDHAKAFYALGQMYAKLPGWPISFGSIENAVSLARKAVDLQERDIQMGLYPNMDYGFYLELARDLHQRNWDQQKRRNEQPNERRKYQEKRDLIERNFYYEGMVPIPNMSDRQEATVLLRKVIGMIQQKPSPTDRDLRTLRDARKNLAEWS